MDIQQHAAIGIVMGDADQRPVRDDLDAQFLVHSGRVLRQRSRPVPVCHPEIPKAPWWVSSCRLASNLPGPASSIRAAAATWMTGLMPLSRSAAVLGVDLHVVVERSQVSTSTSGIPGEVDVISISLCFITARQPPRYSRGRARHR